MQGMRRGEWMMVRCDTCQREGKFKRKLHLMRNGKLEDSYDIMCRDHFNLMFKLHNRCYRCHERVNFSTAYVSDSLVYCLKCLLEEEDMELLKE